MSCPQCGCAIPEIVNIPGLEGDPGTAGTNGQPAYTLTTGSITVPATAGTCGNVTFASTAWMAIGQPYWIIAADGSYYGTFKATALNPDAVTATISWLDYPNDNCASQTIPLGASVVASGVYALANPLPVNSGGTGAVTLTGILVGNGTGAVTAVANPLPESNGGTGQATFAAALTAANVKYPVQAGQATLATGFFTVNSGVTISLNSIVVVSLVTPGGTRTGFAGYKITALTAGAPGTGAFTITAINDSATTLGSCTDVVNYIIVG